MGAKLHTEVLNAGESITISNAPGSDTMGCLSVSYQMSATDGDNGTLQGDFNLPNRPSVPISIPAGGVNNLVTSPTKPWDGITLTCNQGTLNIQLAF